MLVHELQIPLKDFLFSFSTQSYILISQAKIRAREVYQQIIHRSHDLIALSKRQSQDLFKEVLDYFLSLYEQEGMEEYRSQFVEHIREIFGTDSLFLSDFYYGLADELNKRGLHEDSLEFAGRALVIRMKLTGIMSEKTGESHIQLGTVYYKIEYDEEAKRELYAGRIVLSKIHGEDSVSIAQIDCMIGESEMRSFNHLNAFVAFHRCYRSRFFALGGEHYSTDLARRLLNECRDISGTRYYCGAELKDRVHELQWAEFSQRSQQNIVAIFVNRLADDVILTSDQLENLVHASFSFHENLTASLMKKDSRYGMDDIDEQIISVVEVLTALAVQSSPYRMEQKRGLPTSPPGESKKSPSTPNNTIAKLLSASKGVERPKQLTPARTASSMESKSENRLSSTSRLGLSSPKHNSILTQNATSSSLGRPVEQSASSELKTSSSEDRQVIKANVENNKSDVPLIRIPSDASIKDATASEATTPSSSSSSSKQRSWRAIPMNSPLRRAANPNAGFANIDLGSKSYHIARSDASGLIFVRKCSVDVLRQAIRSKVLAVGLFAWYCGGRSLASKTKSKAGAADSGDANSALNALFGKKGAPPGATGGSGESKEEEPTNGPKFAKNPPRPPPIPTSWPPIPFTPDEVKTDAAASGVGDDKDGDGPSDPSAPPKPKLKQVFLTSLPSIEGTFWAEPLESFIPAEELFDDLEEEFAIGGPKKQKLPFEKVAPKPVTTKAAKPPTETVLDPQRGQNINIMLAKFGKKSLESIAEAVISMEAQALGSSVINVLLQFIPTSDEIAKVNKFVEKKHNAPPPPPVPNADGSPASPPPTAEKAELVKGDNKIDQKRLNELKIGKAEQFIFHMSKIKLMDKRLTAMSSILVAQEMQQQIINQSEILLNAVSEVKGCSRLKFILKTCLDLNNILAKYSKTSTTMAGITLSSWAKLSQVKLNSGETAQQYIVNKLLSHIPEALELSNDMPSIDEARTVFINRLGMDVKKLEETLALLQEVQEHDKKHKENPSKLDFDEKILEASLQHLEQHLEHVKKLCQTAKERFELAQKDFVQLVAYFGDTSPPAEPDSFFGELSSLCKSLQAATASASTKQRRKAVAK